MQTILTALMLAALPAAVVANVPVRALELPSATTLAASDLWSGWPISWTGPVTVTVHNPSSQPAALTLEADDFRRMAGDAALPSAGALTVGQFTAGPGCPQDAAGRLTLAPLARCRVVYRPTATAPGDYRVRLNLRGTGVTETAELRILAGHSWVAALVALVIGGLLGGGIAYLRGPFAARAAAYAEAVRLRDRRETLVILAQRAMPIEARDGRFLRDLMSRHLTGVYDGSGGVVDIVERLGLLGELLHHADKAGKLDAANRRKLSQNFTAAISTLEDPDLPSATATIKMLGTAVDAALVAQRDAAHAPDRKFESAISSAAIDVPYVPLFRMDISAADLANARITGELVAAALVFVLFALIALLELWDGRLAWGTFRDFVVAILAGAGVFGGSAAVVQSLRQNVKSL